jgi:hypothetical protein
LLKKFRISLQSSVWLKFSRNLSIKSKVNLSLKSVVFFEIKLFIVVGKESTIFATELRIIHSRSIFFSRFAPFEVSDKQVVNIESKFLTKFIPIFLSSSKITFSLDLLEADWKLNNDLLRKFSLIVLKSFLHAIIAVKYH